MEYSTKDKEQINNLKLLSRVMKCECVKVEILDKNIKYWKPYLKFFKISSKINKNDLMQKYRDFMWNNKYELNTTYITHDIRKCNIVPRHICKETYGDFLGVSDLFAVINAAEHLAETITYVNP